MALWRFAFVAEEGYRLGMERQTELCGVEQTNEWRGVAAEGSVQIGD